jgi:hypothetical protein
MDRRSFLAIPAVGAVALLPETAKSGPLAGEVQLVQTFDRELSWEEIDEIAAKVTPWAITAKFDSTPIVPVKDGKLAWGPGWSWDLDNPTGSRSAEGAEDYEFRLVRYNVNCPYPGDSTAWTSISDHYDGKTEPRWSCPHCGTDERLSSPCTASDFMFLPHEHEAAEAAQAERIAAHERQHRRRRVVFPHVTGDRDGIIDLGDGLGTIGERIVLTHVSAMANGFDSHPGGSPMAVRVVRFDCSDGGTRWVVAAYPDHWDDALVLGKMELSRIA